MRLGLVGRRNEGARFENVIASHLLKWVHWQQTVDGRDYELRYFRNTDGREVDFVVVDGQKPILWVEAKLGDDSIDKSVPFTTTPLSPW